MKFLADLHVHSHYARATSNRSDLEHHHEWAQYKGLTVVGTGDFTHPMWFFELQKKLEPAEEGLFRLKKEYAKERQEFVPASCVRDVRFMLTTEISCIYKKNGRVRKVHHLVFAPSLEVVEKIIKQLGEIGNLDADGRPIVGISSKELLKIVLDASPDCMLVPAHLWTPWFAVFGSKSGYDTLEECFEEMTPFIYAIETGLSSDPAMNWRLSQLDNLTLISNSDAHSPQKLGREANEFCTDLSYQAICDAMKNNDLDALPRTLEFYPEEGKYHADGHRVCKQRLSPKETIACGGVCKVCGKLLTVGVSHRVEKLADRTEEFAGDSSGQMVEFGGSRRRPFEKIVPLPEIISDVVGTSVASKKVQREYFSMLARFGDEMNILREVSRGDLEVGVSPEMAAAVMNVREGRVTIEPGYDGEYGNVKVLEKKPVVEAAVVQGALF